ncbi:MAG: FmdB family zinc ribbon protein [Nitrospirota bacterium]
MPIYEYECTECKKRFDAMQKFSDPQYTECRHCGGKLRKLMGTPALQFKGSGWYITDYAGKKPEPSTGRDKEKSPTKPEDTTAGAAKEKKETAPASPAKGTGAAK